MIPQFVAEQTFKVDWDNIAKGMAIFVMGLFKKVAIADTLSPIVVALFNRVDGLTFLEAWTAVLGYTMQLYFDFSGYSEMAIGLGLMLNLRLPQNFASPYQSRSIIDFWRRWHMTLGLWVKNYLYIPMGGNRHGQLRKMRNLFVSMVLIGLWHGAGWTYVFWGAWHGLMLMINHLWRGLNIKLPQAICWLLTFSGVIIGWVFFRSATFADAWMMLSAMTDIHNIYLPPSVQGVLGFLQNYGIGFMQMSGSLGKPLLMCSVLLVCTVWFKNPLDWSRYFKADWKWFGFILVLTMMSLYMMNRHAEFLYFQF